MKLELKLTNETPITLYNVKDVCYYTNDVGEMCLDILYNNCQSDVINMNCIEYFEVRR